MMTCLSGSVTKIKAQNSIDWGVKSSTRKILKTCVCIIQLGAPGTMASIVQFSQLERWTSLTLPTKSYIKPIEIFPGTGMIIIVAFEYNDTSIGSYNEIGLAVAVKFPPKFIFPGLSAISMMRKNCFSVYIHHLLVEAI